MDPKNSIRVWVVILNGNKMIVITTRNFLPEIGGMQTLMSDLAMHLSKFYEVKVFAEISKDSKKFDESQKYEIIRVKGIKFIRKFRKANQIQDFFLKNKNINALLSDHWKSLEKISKNTCLSSCTICLIHGKEINHPKGSPLNIRMLNSLTKAKYVIANSEFTKNLAIEKGVNENKIVIINPGTNIHENESLDENYTKKTFDQNGVIERFKIQLDRSGISNTNNVLKPDFSWAIDHSFDVGEEPYIYIAPFCSPELQHKVWPYFRELIKLLKQNFKNYEILTAPGPSEIGLCKDLKLKMILNKDRPTNINQLSKIIKRASFVVANDTGPAHIAAHLNVKGLALFGNHTSAKKVSIETNKFKVLEKGNLNKLTPLEVLDTIIKQLST